MPGSVPDISISSQLFIFIRESQVYAYICLYVEFSTALMDLLLGGHGPPFCFLLDTVPLFVSSSNGQVVQSSSLIITHGCLLATILPLKC